MVVVAAAKHGSGGTTIIGTYQIIEDSSRLQPYALVVVTRKIFRGGYNFERERQEDYDRMEGA